MQLFKNVVNIVKDAAEEALHTTPLEKALYNSTSNLSVIPAISDMELISDHTNYYEDSKTIIKYMNKKLKRDNNKRVILRTLDLADYLVKNGAMRIVHEIRDEKYQLKSLKNMLGSDDETEYIELITKKCNSILELLSDEKKLDEERELASQTKNRYKGTGNTSGGFGGSYGGQGRYGGESYEGMGSDAQYKKKREEPRRERERERERDPQDYNPSSGGKYDPHTGSNSLFKKLGIQEKRDEPEQKDDDIEFPAEPTPPKQETRAPISAPTQTQPQKPAPKFLPPPPSKGGAAAQTPGTQTSPPLKVQASVDLIDLGFEPAPKPAPTQTISAPKPAQPSGANLLEFDLFGGPTVAPQQPQVQQKPLGQPQNFGTGFGLNTFGQPQGSSGSTGNNLNQQNGFGNQGFNMGTNTGMNLGMGMNTGFGINQGFNGNNGMNNGFNQGLNTGFGSNMGLGMNTGMGAAGGFGSTPQTQGNQPKKLVTFDSKSNTNDDFGGFQEAKAKDPALKNYTNAEAELIDLSGLTSAKKNQSPSNNLGSINLAGW